LYEKPFMFKLNFRDLKDYNCYGLFTSQMSLKFKVEKGGNYLTKEFENTVT
jgi:hypothetical protein